MNLTFGFSTIDDIKEVSKMFVEVLDSLQYYNAQAKKSERLKYSPDELAKKMADDPLSILVVKDNTEPVGFCFSRFDDYTIWLEWFGITPGYRGKKLGDLILAELEISAIKRGCHKIWCDSRTENLASFKVLHRNGFTVVTTLQDHWYHQDFFLWQKSLHA